MLLLGSEDHNSYTYDIRNLATPSQIYKGHVGGVMGCDWSKHFPSQKVARGLITPGPTGEEFVSGAYDRTIRIFKRDSGRSRDVYHTKRMQRLVCRLAPRRFCSRSQGI